MKTEKLIDSLIKNIDGFNVKKLFELTIKIIINFFKFTDYLSKKILKIKTAGPVLGMRNMIFWADTISV